MSLKVSIRQIHSPRIEPNGPPDSGGLESLGFCKIDPNQTETNRVQPNPSEDQGSRQRIAIIGHLTAGGLGKPKPRFTIFFRPSITPPLTRTQIKVNQGKSNQIQV